LVGRPSGKRSLERPRCWWENNIKMDLREVRGKDQWGKLDLAGSRQGPVAGFCEHGDEALVSIQKAGYSLTS
jgi:hypothetical protein